MILATWYERLWFGFVLAGALAACAARVVATDRHAAPACCPCGEP